MALSQRDLDHLRLMIEKETHLQNDATERAVKAACEQFDSEMEKIRGELEDLKAAKEALAAISGKEFVEALATNAKHAIERKQSQRKWLWWQMQRTGGFALAFVVALAILPWLDIGLANLTDKKIDPLDWVYGQYFERAYKQRLGETIGISYSDNFSLNKTRPSRNLIIAVPRAKGGAFDDVLGTNLIIVANAIADKPVGDFDLKLEIKLSSLSDPNKSVTARDIGPYDEFHVSLRKSGNAVTAVNLTDDIKELLGKLDKGLSPAGKSIKITITAHALTDEDKRKLGTASERRTAFQEVEVEAVVITGSPVQFDPLKAVSKN